MKQEDRKPRRETSGLSRPVATTEVGQDDERRSRPLGLLPLEQKGERGDGFPEPHVVGQDPPRAERLEELKPRETSALVRTKVASRLAA